MRKICNKGHRIRASDKHLVYHFSIGTLLFVFVAVLLLLNTKQLMRTELIKHREDDREYMGRTLYLGSLKSDVYFCIYEKDYEQYVKLGTPLEEADIINRFEIRLRNERAYYAVRDLLTYYDAVTAEHDLFNPLFPALHLLLHESNTLSPQLFDN